MHPKTDKPKGRLRNTKTERDYPLQSCLSGSFWISSQIFSTLWLLLQRIIEPAIFPAVGELAPLCVRQG